MQPSAALRSSELAHAVQKAQSEGAPRLLLTKPCRVCCAAVQLHRFEHRPEGARFEHRRAPIGTERQRTEETEGCGVHLRVTGVRAEHGECCVVCVVL